MRDRGELDGAFEWVERDVTSLRKDMKGVLEGW
jgi:hypothetical protein